MQYSETSSHGQFVVADEVVPWPCRRFPRGLSLMLRAMGNWIYDKDPYEALQWTQALEDFKV